MSSRRRNRAKKYSYVRLSRRRQQIRLFELKPAASRNDPVFGSLHIVDFDEDEEDVPEFDALSYQWGELTPTYEITIVGDADTEGGSLQVRQNLSNALRDLRLSDEPLVIWIDAICINQQDEAEKERQLPLMRQIYSSVRTVRCWIDEDVDPDSEAFRALKGFKTAVKEESIKALRDGNQYSDDDRRKLRLLGKYSWKFWRPVANVFLNEYWSRLWIQQELLLAPCRAFHFRQYVMDDGDEEGLLWFHEIIRQLTNVHPFRSVDDPTSDARVAAKIAKHIYRGRQQESLFGSLVQAIYHSVPYRLAHTFKNWDDFGPMEGSFGPLLHIYLSAQQRLKVSEDRDRVYGILGLARDCKDVEVRYDISVVQTHAQVFKNHINDQADLKFLSLTGRPGLPSEWPSWFPQWQLPMPYQTFPNGRDYQASGTTKAKDGWISEDGYLLGARGICVDRITDCIGASPLEDITIRDLVPLLLHLNSMVISIKDGGRRNNFNRNKGVLSYIMFPPVNDHCFHEVCGVIPKGRCFAAIWRMLQTLSQRSPRLRLRDFLDPDLDFRPWPRAPTWRNMWERVWLYRVACWLGPRQLVLTERGLPGTIHKNSETWRVDRGADEVWVLFGCPVPLVLRPERRSRRYRVVSPIYLPGYSDGALFDGNKPKRSLSLSPVTDIVLC
jgi:hypothetical protein